MILFLYSVHNLSPQRFPDGNPHTHAHHHALCVGDMANGCVQDSKEVMSMAALRAIGSVIGSGAESCSVARAGPTPNSTNSIN